MSYFLLFIEGILTFLSPCLLPMVPLYVAYFGGHEGNQSSRKEIIHNAILFVLGFTTAFVLLSVFVSTIGKFLLIHRRTINLLIGLFMVVMGIDFLRGSRWLNRLTSRAGKNVQQSNTYLFGVMFAISWTPCVGTFLGSALALSLTADSYGQSILMLVFYSLGLGIPFILTAALIDELENSLNWLKARQSALQKISGGFLIIMGIAMASGYFDQLLQWLS